MREKTIETPVEDAGGDEGIDVADAETIEVEMLAWLQPSRARLWLAASSLQQVACGEREGKRLTGVDRPKRR